MSFLTRTPLTKELLPGVSQDTIKKLAGAGITTLEALAVTPARRVVELTDMGLDTATKCTKLALDRVTGFRSAYEYMNATQGRSRISTGSGELDAALGGGVETGIITELSGSFGSGKTQICYTLAVTVQGEPMKAKAAIIDTENTFTADRLMQVARERGLDERAAMEGVMVAKSYNSDHLQLLINILPDMLTRENIKLVVVDSVIGQLRSEYLGRGTLADRQQKLNGMLATLMRYAQAFDVAVVVTNQIESRPDVLFRDPNQPTGGNIMAHAGTQRLYLRRGKDNLRIAKLIDSPNLPESEARFLITEKGIENISEKEGAA